MAGGLSRRTLLVGAAAGGGLALAWAAWPRRYEAPLNLAPGEQGFGGFLKIDRAGQVIVIVPQLEAGQGVYTSLPQILADELGADWRTVAVQPAVPGPLYANSLFAAEWIGPEVDAPLAGPRRWIVEERARRSGLVLTGGSTSIRMFAETYRQAGAAARVLLCKAAAARWDIAWESCDIVAGLVIGGAKPLRLGDLAEEAAGFTLPDILPLRQGDDNRLVGTDAPRLDVPSKTDGSANYAADIRLPDMLFASIRQGPVGTIRLDAVNEAAARKVTGLVDIVRQPGWVATVATNWWAANEALGRLDPRFIVADPPIDDALIEARMAAALAGEEGARFHHRGDLAAAFDKARIVKIDYAVAPALHLAIEPMAATARVRDGQAELWMACQAPGLARRAVARALDLPESAVTLYPLFAGGAFGGRMEIAAGVQAAIIARAVGRPVQLLWSRSEDIMQDRPRPPARATMAATLGPSGRIEAWLAKVAAPCAAAQTWRRVGEGETPREAAAPGKGDARAVAGMDAPYAIPAFAVDHHAVDLPLPVGLWRSDAHSYAAFFTECFIDELAGVAGIEPLSFRMRMLGRQPRLAHCLATAAALGGWQGGVPGSGQGLACHGMAGSHVAVLVEARLAGGRISVPRMVAVADCGTVINPDIVRQQIEGGLIFGIAQALGGAAHYANGIATRRQIGEQRLPRLADIGEIQVELVPGEAPPGGVGEIAVPPAAPALAGALHSLTGRRYRQLPLLDMADGSTT
jgi:isoquinoline 1-oxidoreductase beta subunit